MVLGLFQRKGSSSNLSTKDTIDALKTELAQLRLANTQLQDQLKATGTTVGEYMYEYQSMQSNEWELKYIVLSGTNIKIYKSSKDVMFNPNEAINVKGCSLEWEGVRKSSYWTFSIVDQCGNLVVRLATLSGGVALKWVDMLAAVGCTQEPSSGSEADSTCSTSSSMRGMVRRSSFESLPGATTQVAPSTSREGSQHLQLHRSSSSISDTRTSRNSPKPVDGILPKSSLKKESAGHKVDKSFTEPAKLAALHEEEKGGVAKGAKGSTSTRARKAGEELEGVKTATGEANPIPSKHRTKLPMSGSTPVHSSLRSSYLSSERVWLEKYTGLYNLSLVVLVVSNFRLVLENLLMYGWRYNPVAMIPGLTVTNSNIPLALCYPFLVFCILLSFGTEQLGLYLLGTELKFEELHKKKTDSSELDRDARRKKFAMATRHEWFIVVIHLINTTAALVVPCVVIGKTKAEPGPAFMLLVLATILWMKLISYHHCNWDLRQARRGGFVQGLGKPPKSGTLRPGERGAFASNADADDWAVLKYPENLTLTHLGYFLAFPTLVYQVNYPRTEKVRWGYIAWRLLELMFMLTLMSLIIKQFVEPVLNSALGPFTEMNWPRLIERVLRLAMPSTLVWLVAFYCLFHLWLNILAEITRFGDREFYKDWWNASTLGEYWKLWNMPVHKWLLRHVYFPALRFGFPRYPALLLTFFISAVFHELLVGVPLHMLRYWVFMGMMGQVPLVAFTELIRKKLKRDEWGNIVFWLSFCILGQPICVLIYTHDFLLDTGLKEVAL